MLVTMKTRSCIFWDVVSCILKTFLSYSLKMTLWKKPKHVAVMFV